MLTMSSFGSLDFVIVCFSMKLFSIVNNEILHDFFALVSSFFAK